jgi:hypothetical protein
MRTFFVLLCSLALACAAAGAQKEDKSKKQAPKKNQAQATQQQVAAPGGRPQKTAAHHASSSYSARVGSTSSYQKKTKSSQQVTTAEGRSKSSERKLMDKTQIMRHAGPSGSGMLDRPTFGEKLTPKMQKTKGSQLATTGSGAAQKTKGKTKGSQQTVTQRGQAARGHGLGMDHTLVNKNSSVTKYNVKHFNLQTKTRPATIKSVTFQQNRRIVGSQNWVGPNYTVFRTYTPVWHDRIWWRNHYNRVVFVYGGWYYWNAGWWYPAWGYALNTYYAYDGPIYAYNSLPPDQVIANVQAALQEQGYYQGEVDGLLGPLTRDAIADYQRDHGLYETAAIDQPTLQSLGMS